jgi:hypothetical protein
MSAFTKDADAVTVPCCGINHSDRGVSGTCDNCGKQVARRDDGAVFDIQLRGSYSARKLSCWGGSHRCDPETVARWAEHKSYLADQGVILKGMHVVVVKGRKVPLGTAGVVKWTGVDSYDTPRVGLAVEGTEKLVYTATANVKVAS